MPGQPPLGDRHLEDLVRGKPTKHGRIDIVPVAGDAGCAGSGDLLGVIDDKRSYQLGSLHVVGQRLFPGILGFQFAQQPAGHRQRLFCGWWELLERVATQQRPHARRWLARRDKDLQGQRQLWPARARQPSSRACGPLGRSARQAPRARGCSHAPRPTSTAIASRSLSVSARRLPSPASAIQGKNES
jgi:hypothetical protein